MSRNMIKPQVTEGEFLPSASDFLGYYKINSFGEKQVLVAIVKTSNDDCKLLSQAKNMAEYLEKEWRNEVSWQNVFAPEHSDTSVIKQGRLKKLAEIETILTAAGYSFEEQIPAMLCEHANEVPGICNCAQNCYCKEHTCKDK